MDSLTLTLSRGRETSRITASSPITVVCPEVLVVEVPRARIRRTRLLLEAGTCRELVAVLLMVGIRTTEARLLTALVALIRIV